MLSKENLLKVRLGAVNEAVFKQGDVYKVKSTIDVPKSLINAFVSKSKKEHDKDPKEAWSEMDLAEMMVNYVLATYLNIDSIPVDAIMGESTSEVSTEVTPAEVTPAVTETPAATTETPAATTTETPAETTETPGPEGTVEA